MRRQGQIGRVFALGALLILFANGAPSAANAQDLSVQGFVGETTIGTEETVTYTLEIKGADFSKVETPQAPEAEGLVLMQPVPSTQQNYSIINGQMTQSVGFQWSYRPVHEGDARILAATVTANGKHYQTDPIRITVVPQSQRPQRSRRASPSLLDPFGNPFDPPSDDDDDAESNVNDEDIFIRAVPSANEAYQNEQVTIEYKLFFRNYIQPRHSRLADSWDAEGFWREELDVEARPMPRSSIENGLRYNSIVLKRVAVFPTRSGTLSVDPLRIETEVFAPRSPNDPFSRFFSLRNPYETIERSSPSVRINAKPLPPGAPPAFTGAVGSFDMTAQINHTQVEVGEPIQLTLHIKGTGNLAMLESPPLNAPGIFEAYDPEVKTDIDASGRRVGGQKTFTYLLVPRSNGTFEIPPIEFDYFDPSTRQYRTLRSDPMTIRVTGDAHDVPASSAMANGLPVDDIASPLTQGNWTRINQTPLYRSLWVYGLLLLPVLLIGVTYAFRRHVTRLTTDMAYARNRRAHPVARKHLKQAETLMQNDEPRAFYEELERAVLGFIGNRLNIAELGLTRLQLDARLEAAGVEQAPRQAMQQFLETCDAARFAPDRPSRAQMEASLDEAHNLIVTLNTVFNRQADPAVSE